MKIFRVWRFCGYFFWGGGGGGGAGSLQNGLVSGVISLYFSVFLKINVKNGEFFGVSKFF